MYVCLSTGHVTVFEFPVAVLAVNDRPHVAAPAGLEADENELVAVRGVSVTDIDADEIPLGAPDRAASGACPPPAGEVHHALRLELATANGKLFVNDTGVDALAAVVVRHGPRDARLEYML